MKQFIKKYLGKNNVVQTRIFLYRLVRFFANPLRKECSLPTLSLLKHTFFGYYDVTPFHLTKNLILATYIPTTTTSFAKKGQISVGFFSLDPKPCLEKKQWKVCLKSKESPFTYYGIDTTDTWCLQQGCRLQWFDAQHVLYNRLVNGKYGCVLHNLSKIVKEYARPIYAISSCGRWGLSLNFSRLERLRPGYGYSNFPDTTQKELCPKEDGIWRIDLKTGAEKLLFSLWDIAAIEPREDMAQAEHYFNQIMFNPSNTRFMFFHLGKSGKKRFHRLFTSDIEGKNLCLLNNDGFTSHYAWRSETELLAYASHNNQSHFYLYQDQSSKRQIIGKDILTQDGHPTFIDQNTILLDTYPDRFRDQHLYLYDMATNQKTPLGSFYSPFKFSDEKRCDLHPRVNPDGTKICIDSIDKNARQMKIITIKSQVHTWL